MYMRKFDRFRENLRMIEEADGSGYVYSYDTKVAEIDHLARTVIPLGYWSVTTSKHINYVAREYGYEVVST